MLFELIAVIVVGVAMAGIAMTLRFVSRQTVPRWVVPVFAGLGMIAYTVWSEYSWFSRVSTALPAEVPVAWHNEDAAFWRPWSYIVPVTTRFTAVDQRTTQRNDAFPDQVMIDVILAARWQQSARVKVVFDCAANRRADLVGRNVSISPNGEIIGADWISLGPDDPVLRTACRPAKA
ncbi:hypothetical protein [Rhizobium sp. SSA_523]|uniref:hypothetical protein n=1 Tax=Rhizobium sp. SSA_523 TaxID=2952477 RepID=UPI002090126E|nr:hypothetical protein [Rhizobium sp. SSA_523]MCO5733099.1 hypothetical protein [Rhizobium sp. SSA_523]WKC23977.1 hypothetical protein QTJ18_24955 [Rhizobium sp. SSA_523]